MTADVGLPGCTSYPGQIPYHAYQIPYHTMVAIRAVKEGCEKLGSETEIEREIERE